MKDSREKAIKYGIDLTLTEANLKLTPEKRLEQHQRALHLVETLQQAKKIDSK